MTRLMIVPSLWYTKDAEGAARFYASIFPDSKVGAVTPLPASSPSGPAGSVIMVDFTLCGQRFMAMTAAPIEGETFNHMVSFTVECADQKEVDRYSEALGKGGSQEPCGWVRDRFGLSWQIVPVQLREMMTATDRKAAGRAAEAMLKMKKLDLAELQRAFKDG